MQPLTKRTLSIYLQHALKYRGLFIWMISCVFVVTALDLVRPIALKYMFDTVIAPSWSLITVFYILGAWVVVGFVRFVVWRLVGKSNNNFQPKLISDLMDTCYEYMLKHSHSFYADNFAGSIQTKVRKFAYAFEAVSDQVCFELGRSILLILLLVVILLFYFWQIGLMVLAWVIIYFAFTYFFAKFKLKHDIAQAVQDTVVTAHLAETLTNHSNINLFAAHDREVKAFREITQLLFELRKRAWDYGLIAEVFQGISMMFLEAVIMVYMIFALYYGRATVGDLVFAQAYLGRVFENTWNMGRNIRKVYEQLANANEMTEMLLKPHEVQDLPQAVSLQVKSGNIDFRNVCFNYIKDNSVFENFNLEIPGGRKIALVGPSGAGKSTIVKMLLRLIDINSGAILIDGQGLTSVTQKSLHEIITVVPQEPLLFHRSLSKNILYGNPSASMDDVIEVSKMAHCHQFIEKFPKKYDTLVGERGVKLSGGERQRVAIARAMLRNSPILILDEATSSLDSESESYIQDALHTLMKGKTTIVIAHRLSTIKEMDWIYVLDDGQIIEQGTHHSLIANAGKYCQHWNIQSGGFVLNEAVAA